MLRLMNTRACLAAIACLSVQPCLHAQPFQGAEAALERIAAASTKPAEKKEANPVGELRDKFKAFRTNSLQSPPQEAATQWLALFDTFQAIPRHSLYRYQQGRERMDLAFALGSLPPVEAWPLIAKELRTRKPTDNPLQSGSLRLLAAVLDGGLSEVKKEYAALRTALENPNRPGTFRDENVKYIMESADRQLQEMLGSDKEKSAALETQIDRMEKLATLKDNERADGYFTVPDLVKLAGEAKATQLLERILPLAEHLSVDGDATRKVAARSALKLVGKLKKPHWDLVQSQEDIALFEALEKQFPGGGDDHGRDRSSAAAVYLLSLVATKRTDDAAAFAQNESKKQGRDTLSLSTEFLVKMQRAGLGKEVLAFLKKVLSDNPALPFWGTFIQLSAQEGASVEALAFLKLTQAKADLPPGVRAEIQMPYAYALLGADQTPEGVAVIREILKRGPVLPTAASGKADELKSRLEELGVEGSAEVESLAEGSEKALSDYARLAMTLVDVGVLLKNPALVEEGLAAARSTIKKSRERSYMKTRIVDQLLKLGRGAEAEAEVIADLEEAARPKGEENRWSSMGESRRNLALLAEVYQRSGRNKDVLILLEQSPAWAATDLSDLRSESGSRRSLLLIAATALAAEGRKEEALKVAWRAVQQAPEKDAGYQLLLSLGDSAFEQKMDALYQQNRFEERPLIWKAKAQLDAGRVDDAEKTIRAAIAVDPSDGEQGKGDRMRAYAVLGDILEKKGDVEQAKVMRGAVAAIRLSETADDWWTAGMLSRAVKMYEEVLTLFADAYCIQSRLALRYSEMGDFAKAEMHYRRAYELMPESFGRVESHCFGCEGAFRGERAQAIAEEVFTKLAEKMADRPQIFYLLGYLRENQQRSEEALASYLKAVALDPDYLNAWVKIQSLGSAENRDAAAMALLRLDPTGRKASFTQISDVKALWTALLAAERKLPKPDLGPIFPLPASKVAMQSFGPEAMQYLRVSSEPDSVDLRQHLLQNNQVLFCGTLLEQASQMR